MTTETRKPESVGAASRPRRRPIRRTVTSALLSMAMAGTLAMVTPGTAEAVTVRPGAKWGQVDVLLDTYETEQVRRSFWAATVVCWNSGVGGALLSIGVCQTAITVCAAQAYYASPRRRAGMTVTFWGQYWCWKY
ncbi:hypothetical protein ACFCW4_36050 [Streptomyces virginiae]|uniref:hypothetical protein n=1 Tax=Streptomyces virginiae TaxID=1961 RepID=UPI0035D708CC